MCYSSLKTTQLIFHHLHLEELKTEYTRKYNVKYIQLDILSSKNQVLHKVKLL